MPEWLKIGALVWFKHYTLGGLRLGGFTVIVRKLGEAEDGVHAYCEGVFSGDGRWVHVSELEPLEERQ